jgi:di/tricarboxylate transporter
MRLRDRFGVNLLAVSRAGRREVRRLRDIAVAEGDVLLAQGAEQDVADFIADYGCAPLAVRSLRLPKRRKMALALALLVGAAVVGALGVVPIAIAYGCAALLAILTSVTPARSVLGAVDWSVVVLLGALIPVAAAVESSGLAEVAAQEAIARGGEDMHGPILVAVLLLASMLLTNILNNAAAVAMMAPVALSVASSLGISPEPLLMAIAIGS